MNELRLWYWSRAERIWRPLDQGWKKSNGRQKLREHLRRTGYCTAAPKIGKAQIVYSQRGTA
jgi:hypothetical protein